MIDLINSNDFKAVRKNLDIGVIRRGFLVTRTTNLITNFSKKKNADSGL